MSQIAIKGATTGTGVFTLESPATNTDRTLILPDEAGTVLTSATSGVPVNGPTFRVEKNASQNPLSINAWNKVVWDSNETWDVGGCFDTANNRFQPSLAGYYQINTALELSYNTGGATAWSAAFYKNGVEYGTNVYEAGSVANITLSDMVYMNGSSDYVEVFLRPNGGSLVGVYQGSSFSASLVRSAT